MIDNIDDKDNKETSNATILTRCKNCVCYEPADSTCRFDAPVLRPTRNDLGPDYSLNETGRVESIKLDKGGRPVEFLDNPAVWGGWPCTSPNDWCMEFRNKNQCVVGAASKNPFPGGR
jgi:hypothetical protein